MDDEHQPVQFLFVYNARELTTHPLQGTIRVADPIVWGIRGECLRSQGEDAGFCELGSVEIEDLDAVVGGGGVLANGDHDGLIFQGHGEDGIA